MDIPRHLPPSAVLTDQPLAGSDWQPTVKTARSPPLGGFFDSEEHFFANHMQML